MSSVSFVWKFFEFFVSLATANGDLQLSMPRNRIFDQKLLCMLLWSVEKLLSPVPLNLFFHYKIDWVTVLFRSILLLVVAIIWGYFSFLWCYTFWTNQLTDSRRLSVWSLHRWINRNNTNTNVTLSKRNKMCKTNVKYTCMYHFYGNILLWITKQEQKSFLMET